MLEHWGRPACPGAQIPQRDCHLRVSRPGTQATAALKSPARTRVVALGGGAPIAEVRDGEPDPTSPLRITLPRPLHLPSGWTLKRDSRLRENHPWPCFRKAELAPPKRGQAGALFEVPSPVLVGTGDAHHESPGSRLSRCRARLAPANTAHRARCPPL